VTLPLTHEAIYEVASKNAPPSIGMDILIDHYGFLLMDLLGNYPKELVIEAPDLTGFAVLLAEEVLQLSQVYALAPFDGTLAEGLEEGDTEKDWLIREDLMPYVLNWHKNVRGML
jgi:hypothetical protein